LVAEVLQHHNVKFLFTLVGGHISPILVAAEKLGIKVVDTRHEVRIPSSCTCSIHISAIKFTRILNYNGNFCEKYRNGNDFHLKSETKKILKSTIIFQFFFRRIEYRSYPNPLRTFMTIGSPILIEFRKFLIYFRKY